jgi:hypothetical protein
MLARGAEDNITKRELGKMLDEYDTEDDNWAKSATEYNAWVESSKHKQDCNVFLRRWLNTYETIT